MIAMRFDTPFEITGEWCLGSDTEKLSGTLVYEPRNLLLRIFKPNSETNLFPSLNGKSPRKLYGTLTDGSKVTLYDCFEASHSIAQRLRGSSMIVEYSVSECLRGGHFSSPPKYKKMSYAFPGLDVWIDKSAVSLDHGSMVTGHPAPAVNIDWGNNMEFDIPCVDAKAKLHLGFKCSSVGINGMQIYPITNLIIEPKKIQQRDWYFDQYQRIRSFLSFVSGMQFWPSREIGMLSSENVQIEHIYSMAPIDYANPRNKTEFRIDFSVICGQLDSLLKKWFEIYDSIYTPVILYHGLQRQHEIDSDMRFIWYMQALESLHREMDNQAYVTPEDYKQYYEAMVASIPSALKPDHRQSLKSRLRYGYEFSLQSKMKHLVKLLDSELVNEILGDKKFPRKWIDTRNYLTHRDSELTDKILSGLEQHNVLYRLEMFIWVLVLKMVGVDEAQLKAAAMHFLSNRIIH